MNTRISTILSASALILAASSANAAITGTTGFTTQIGPPPACGFGALSGFTAFAWDEQVGRGFAGLADMVNNPATIGSALPGAISGVYDSHFIHFEGVPGIVGVSGTVTFNNPIVAVMFNQPNLDASDAPLGAFATVYPTGYPLRGCSAASFFSINTNVLTFQLNSFTVTGDIEQIRVLTQAPTPGACTALMAGTALMGARRRRM